MESSIILELLLGILATLLAAALITVWKKLKGRPSPDEVFLSRYSGETNIETGEGESLRSKHAYTRTEIEFDNRLSEPVDIYWINYQGGREKYHTLPSMQTKRIKTFVSHPWIIEKVSDGQEVRRIIADGSMGRVIIAE
jgi:hypothetical protein